MKTLFFGTSAFAVPSLHAVAERTQLFGVVTQPDRPSGRGQRLRPSPVKTAALERNLRVFEPARLRSFAAEMAGEDFDLFALASYGRILPRELLALPRIGALNVHPSLLPKYRGATPIQTAILQGEAQTGVSIILMDDGLDSGDLVLQRSAQIEPGETYGELHDRLAPIGAQLLDEAIQLAARGALPRTPQTGEPTLTRPIAKGDLLIDWNWAPERIARFVRAYAPQPAARAQLRGEVVKVLRAHIDDSGRLAIDELIAPNRGRMSGESFHQMSKEKGMTQEK